MIVKKYVIVTPYDMFATEILHSMREVAQYFRMKIFQSYYMYYFFILLLLFFSSSLLFCQALFLLFSSILTMIPIHSYNIVHQIQDHEIVFLHQSSTLIK